MMDNILCFFSPMLGYIRSLFCILFYHVVDFGKTHLELRTTYLNLFQLIFIFIKNYLTLTLILFIIFVQKKTHFLYQANAQCGKRPSATSRVIGGSNASPNSWPWQVVLLADGRPGCGGSIVSPEFIVTAAHCVVDQYDRVKSASRLTIK